jgi:AmmeMemoRadiSam system protein A
MVHSACNELPATDRQRLLTIARNAIVSGVGSGIAPRVELEKLPPSLLAHRGAFVTLTIEQRLRGCVGSLVGHQALAQSVSDAAHSAAFRDHRFAPLDRQEVEGTHIEISVLSPTEPMDVVDRDHLLQQLAPGIDGLLVRDGSRSATFLPKVWEQLPSPEEFLGQLLRKAGLPENHWSSTLSFERYGTTCFGESFTSVSGQCH